MKVLNVAVVVLAAMAYASGRCMAQDTATGRRSAAQEDFRGRLVQRGLPADLAASVAVVAQTTAGKGLPAQLIVNKAIEGWFKHVPPERIVGALRDLAQRLERARAELSGSGVAATDGAIIGAAAEARAQGVSRADAAAIVRAAPDPASAAAGLSVSAALVVQGLDAGASARLVIGSFRAGRSAAQVLDLPAAARALQARGVAATDVGRQLLAGIGVDAQGSVIGRGNAKAPLIPQVPIHP